MTVQGAIAVDDSLDKPSTDGVTITWGDQTFTIDNVTDAGKGKYTFKKDPAIPDALITGAIDLTKCTFKITVKATNIEAQSGDTIFGIAFGSFNQTDEYTLR